MYVVTYSGHFAFLKPWYAVRDRLVFSQRFLAPSTLEGIRRKLKVTEILRNKLVFSGMSKQQEVIKSKHNKKAKSIIIRNVLVYPELKLGFASEFAAKCAIQQHIVLGSNENLLFPKKDILELTHEQFDKLRGVELKTKGQHKIFLGRNQYMKNEAMYGYLDNV